MTDSSPIRENHNAPDGVPLSTLSEPIELDYAAKGRRRELANPQDRGVMRVLTYGLVLAVLLPMVLGVVAVIAALLIF